MMDPRFDSARKYSNGFFVAADAARQTTDLYLFMTTLSNYDNAAAIIIDMIPEYQRTEADNSRIMLSYECAMHALIKSCDHMITTHQVRVLQGRATDQDSHHILMLIERLQYFADKAVRQLDSMMNRNFDFRLCLSLYKELLDYHSHMACWEPRAGDVLSSVLKQDVYTALKYAESQALPVIREKIEPKSDEFGSQQWRDLASCYYSIAKLYQKQDSITECLESAMKAIAALDAIERKDAEDIGCFMSYYVPMSSVVYEKDKFLQDVVRVGYGFFIGSEASVKNFNNVYQRVCEHGDNRIANELMLQVMKVIYNNYLNPNVYNSELKQALNSRNFNAEFKQKLDHLAAHVAGNDARETYTPMRRYG